jgi:NAD(P)-dependent dehydrogenase (short-subunit alcohol dehydrogenase family)
MMGQCQAVVAEAVHNFGRIDILLCCTSQAVVGTVEELAASNRTQSLVRDQFETNFFGPMNVIKATLPSMREQKIGHMIVLGGITGHLGTPGLGMYCAANWALEGFCDSIAYEIAPFNIKMTIVQASIEIGILLNRITSAPAHPAYSPEANNAPLFRGILDGLLNRLPGIRAQHATQFSDPQSPSSQSEWPSGRSLLSRNEVVSLYPPLSQAHTEKLLAETVHALTAIGGHENPPARHIVGVEGVASVKEKLKTVSEELEDFIEASNAVDVPRGSQGHAKPEIADGDEDGPIDFGGHETEDKHINA